MWDRLFFNPEYDLPQHRFEFGGHGVNPSEDSGKFSLTDREAVIVLKDLPDLPYGKPGLSRMFIQIVSPAIWNCVKPGGLKLPFYSLYLLPKHSA